MFLKLIELISGMILIKKRVIFNKVRQKPNVPLVSGASWYYPGNMNNDQKMLDDLLTPLINIC
jgi:hypothetical protein